MQFVFNHDEPSGHRCAFPCRQPLRRQPRADARRLPGLPGARASQHRHRRCDDADALGHAATATHWRSAGHQHPQHVIAALARLVKARVPLSGAVQQLCRVRPGAEPRDEEKGRGLVRAE